MGKFHMGINMGHDRSVAVVRDGEILVAIEQERLDRIKHSVGFMLQSPDTMGQVHVPGEGVRYCLDTLGLPLAGMATITANMPGSDFAPQIVRGKFSVDIAHRVREVPSHHLAHAYSTFWPSGFDEAVVLVVDASGETISGESGGRTESYTLYEGRGTTLQELHGETVRQPPCGAFNSGFRLRGSYPKGGICHSSELGTELRRGGKTDGPCRIRRPAA